MPTVTEVSPKDLAKLSELRGGRISRSFELFHVKPISAGALASSYEFFRNTSGASLDIDHTASTDMSNIVMGGKFDEPMLITNVGFFLFVKNTGVVTDQAKQTDYMAITASGRFVLELNNQNVLERSPLYRLGSVLNYGGFASVAIPAAGSANMLGHVSAMKRAEDLDPYLFAEEGLTLRATMNWSHPPTVTNDILLGVYLIGTKYFKA
jgi:hypothetical protein